MMGGMPKQLQGLDLTPDLEGSKFLIFCLFRISTTAVQWKAEIRLDSHQQSGSFKGCLVFEYGPLTLKFKICQCNQSYQGDHVSFQLYFRLSYESY